MEELVSLGLVQNSRKQIYHSKRDNEEAVEAKVAIPIIHPIVSAACNISNADIEGYQNMHLVVADR